MTNPADQKFLGRMEEAVETLKEVAANLQDSFGDLNTNVTRLNANLENMASDFKEHVVNDNKFYDNASNRLASLEGSRSRLLGVASGAGIAGGGFTMVIGWVLKALGGHQ